MATVGSLVTAARVKAKLTQVELARKTRQRRGWIAALETDRMSKPAPERLRAIAVELGLDQRELLALTDQLGAAEEDNGNGDMAALIAALTAQTAALNRVADRLEAQPIQDLETVVELAIASTLRLEAARVSQAASSRPKPQRERQGSRS